MDADQKGYLTHVRAGIGTVSTVEVKEYVRKSKHPEIQVIQTGAPSYFYRRRRRGPTAGSATRGTTLITWRSTSDGAVEARFGRLWIDQVLRTGVRRICRAELRDLRWHGRRPIPPGSAGLPGRVVQVRRRHGRSASCAVRSAAWEVRCALALTGKEITGVHYSSPDRSLLTGQLDTAIVNGKARFSFHLFRKTDANSLTAYFTGNNVYEKDVAVRVAAKTGRISYASGADWVETNHTVPLQQWYPIAIELDADARTYSAYAGENGAQICTNVPSRRRKIDMLRSTAWNRSGIRFRRIGSLTR